MNPLGVVGCGSWGTALAVHLASEERPVLLWARRKEFVAEVKRIGSNEQYLPGVSLPASIRLTAVLEDLGDCDPILVVVPSHGFREVVRSLLGSLAADRRTTLVSCTKGVEEETLARMSQICFEEGVASDREVDFAVLSGPTFAAELAVDMPSAAVVASENADLAARLRQELATPRLRLYSSTDVAGVELGGAAKNVVAIAAGVLSGLGYGYNTQAALLTRGLHEITRLGLAYGGRSRTFAGLAGMGDLVLTATGSLSRNRRAGIALATGGSMREATGLGQVAEGLKNSRTLARLAARRGVEMPITDQMVEIIYEGKSPRQAINELMTRELKAEAEL